MDVDDNKYEKLRAKMKAPLLPARRIGDAVPKKRWLVSRRLNMPLRHSRALSCISCLRSVKIDKYRQAARRILPDATQFHHITLYISGAKNHCRRVLHVGVTNVLKRRVCLVQGLFVCLLILW